MSKFSKLQLLGPVVVFWAVFVAEAAAFGLSQLPTSEVLWRLNLELFYAFQQGHYLLAPVIGLPFSQFAFVAAPLLVVALGGLLTGRELPLAVASNLSFVYTAFLMFVGVNPQPHHLVASLAEAVMPTHPSHYLAVLLVAVSLLSAAISHSCYLRQIRAQR